MPKTGELIPMPTPKRPRFVTPEIVRLTLPDQSGDWIDVKRQLTVGEERQAFASLVREVRADGRITPDLTQIGKAETLAYLHDWSFTDASDKRVPVSEAALDALDRESFDAVVALVESHKVATEAARVARPTTSGSDH